MKILLTGATGLIGQELGLRLAREGHDLIVVSRSRIKALQQVSFPCEIVEGDLSETTLKLPEVDAVFHLMGESVADKRWSEEQKKKILDSRVISTRNLVQSLKSPPQVLISSSAIGYYGDSADKNLDENSAPGSDFLADVCEKWEAEVDKVAKSRVVKARTGIVLSSQGGALTKMLTPFQAGVGGALGDGKQWMSWIHIDDMVGLFMEALKNPQLSGPVNFTSSQPVQNLEFSECLASTLGKWLGPKVPKLALKALFGELAGVLLSSQKVVPKKALDAGYKFKFTNLKEALSDVLKAQSQGEEVLRRRQYFPLPIEEVFAFYSEAKNLETITPELLHFKILNMSTSTIQKNTLINYKLKVRGVPINWQTQIEKWDPPHSFVDVSIKGPYRLWHHTHQFETLGKGTLMTDTVRYQLPLGYVGWLGGQALVKNDVKQIFDFRREKVAEIFKIR